MIESDHNILILNISCPWDVKVKKERTEIFNLRNKKCQEEFFNNTNNTDVLSKCLNNRNVVTGGKLWLKSVKNLILKSFRKIRLTNQENKSKVQNLLSKRKEMSKGSVDEEITEEICKRNKQIILEQISGMSDTSGNMNRVKMWKIKQRVCPKRANCVPVAKKDEDGNLVSNKTQLQQLYVSVYKHRLRHRIERPEYRQMKEHKEYLFQLRLKLAKTRKSPNWTQSDLSKVMKKLKVNKATDPVGLVTELFKPGVAGFDMVKSVLTLCNMIKEECKIPDFVKMTNITSIYKQKGSKMELNSE